MNVRIIGIALAWIAIQHNAQAQETSTSLAQTLQEQFLNAPAVSFNFILPEVGRVTILDDVHGGHVRMQTPKMTIVSDGKTVWNYDKSANRETIDNVANGSPFRDASSLFRFADNYTSRITAQHGGSRYSMELTPNSALQSLFGAAGNLQSLTLELQIKKNTVKIVSASVSSSKGSAKAEHLTISILKRVPSTQFSIAVPPTATVTDLRE